MVTLKRATPNGAPGPRSCYTTTRYPSRRESTSGGITSTATRRAAPYRLRFMRAFAVYASALATRCASPIPVRLSALSPSSP
jgi:hypothetical protein